MLDFEPINYASAGFVKYLTIIKMIQFQNNQSH